VIVTAGRSLAVALPKRFLLTCALILASLQWITSAASAIRATNSLEGGTPGVAISPANSGGASGTAFDAVKKSKGATLAFDEAQAAHGSRSMRLQTTSGATHVQWREAIGASDMVWGRVYVFLAVNPPSSLNLIRALNGTSPIATFRVTTRGTVQILDANNVVRAASSRGVGLGGWTRIEFFVDPATSTTGQAEVRLYAGDSASPFASSAASATNFGTALTTVRFGQTQGKTAREMWLDDLEVNSGGWPGPAGPPQPAQCSDGTDNDGDGLTDFPLDPGCSDASDNDETDAPPPPAAQCSDGTDNDGDGLTDFPLDPGCSDASDNDETDPVAANPGLVATAGDIACSPNDPNYAGNNRNFCQHRRTADLLADAEAVVTLGDHVYENGTLKLFNTSYDPSWGRHASKTYPALGNHEYHDPAGGAKGYFDYWTSKGRPTGGSGAGYYSWDLRTWHMIALNTSRGSNGTACQVGPSCAEGSPQNDWLEQDLAGVPSSSCVLAYWHHPLFNSGTDHGNEDTSAVRPLWEDLYAAGADIILTGHEHNYQRYVPLTPTGTPSADGITQFVVGTGGKNLDGFLTTPDSGLETGVSIHGVLKLQLDASSYSWSFVDIDGTVQDSGGPVACHGSTTNPVVSASSAATTQGGPEAVVSTRRLERSP